MASFGRPFSFGRLPFRQAAQAGALDGRDVHEDIAAAAVRLDEAKPLVLLNHFARRPDCGRAKVCRRRSHEIRRRSAAFTNVKPREFGARRCEIGPPATYFRILAPAQGSGRPRRSTFQEPGRSGCAHPPRRFRRRIDAPSSVKRFLPTSAVGLLAKGIIGLMPGRLSVGLQVSKGLPADPITIGRKAL